MSNVRYRCASPGYMPGRFNCTHATTHPCTAINAHGYCMLLADLVKLDQAELVRVGDPQEIACT